MDHGNGFVGVRRTTGNRQVGTKDAVEDFDASADLQRGYGPGSVDTFGYRRVILMRGDRGPSVERNVEGSADIQLGPSGLALHHRLQTEPRRWIPGMHSRHA